MNCFPNVQLSLQLKTQVDNKRALHLAQKNLKELCVERKLKPDKSDSEERTFSQTVRLEVPTEKAVLADFE